MSSRLYGSLRVVKVLLALLRSTSTVLAPPRRQGTYRFTRSIFDSRHNNRGADDNHLPPGDGRIDWEQFLRS